MTKSSEIHHQVREIHAKYQFRKKLATGGCSDVFHAVDRKTGADVAIKMIQSDFASLEQDLDRRIARFRRETSLYRNLKHPNIVQFIDSGETDNGILFIVFELVNGYTLAKLLSRDGALCVPRVKAYMTQVLSGLVAAHAAGIVHRDIKPENIMIVQTGDIECAKILDFGLASLVRQDIDDSRQLTRTREFIGTPAYASPEQLRGEPISLKSDLYAWGLVFLECLTGEAPFAGNSVAETIQHQLSESRVPTPPTLAEHPLGSLLAWVLEKDTTRRAGDSAHVLTRLNSVSVDNLCGEGGFLRDSAFPSDDDIGNVTGKSLTVNINRERRQVTVLCFSLSLESMPNSSSRAPVGELHMDLMRRCTNIIKEIGGSINGALGDRIEAVFGYPNGSDTDTRRAAYAALKLLTLVTRSNTALKENHGIVLSCRIGIHTGMATIQKPTKDPAHFDGLASCTAGTLCTNAAKGEIIVNDTTRRLISGIIECEAIGDGHPSGGLNWGPFFRIIGEHLIDGGIPSEKAPTTPFVGRQEQIRHLENKFELARNGQGRPLLLYGEAGIGKSRLISEFTNGLFKTGHTRLECRCTPEASNSPLHPILTLLRNSWGLRPQETSKQSLDKLEKRLSEHNMPLNQAMPLFCDWLRLPDSPFLPRDISPQRQKQEMFEYCATIMANIAMKQHAVLVVEDLHWSDPTTTEFLPTLFGQMKKCGVFVLLTARTSFAPKWGVREVSVLTLESLEASAVETLVRQKPNARPLTPELIAEIVERADGVPLFVEELARVIHENHDEMAAVASSKTASSIEIPDTLRGLFSGRLDRLGPAKETAQLAATLGRSFDFDLLSRISPCDETTLLCDLDQLVSAGLIQMWMRVGNPEYMFHHALLRDAAYESLDPEMRVATHLQVASILERDFKNTYRARPELLAFHWAAAEKYDKAIDYGLMAAQKAYAASFYSEAIALAEPAIDWLEHIRNDPSKTDTELQLIQVLYHAYSHTQGYAVPQVFKQIQRAKALLDQVDSNSQHLSATLWGMMLYHYVRGEYPKFDTVTSKAINRAREKKEVSDLAAYLGLQGQTYFVRGRFAESKSSFEEVLQLCPQDIETNSISRYGHDTRLFALATYAMLRCIEGDQLKAFSLLDEAMDQITPLKSTHSIGCVMTYRLGMLHYVDDREHALKLSEELLDYAERNELKNWLIMTKILNAWARLDLEEATSWLNCFVTSGGGQVLSYWNFCLAQIEYETGKPEDALKRLNTYIDQAQTIGELYYLAELYRLKTLCQHRLGVESHIVLRTLENAKKAASGIGARLFWEKADETETTIRSFSR